MLYLVSKIKTCLGLVIYSALTYVDVTVAVIHRRRTVKHHLPIVAIAYNDFPAKHSTLVFKMDEAAAAKERETEADRPLVDLTYFRDTWTGRLKIVELFCSLLAGALVPASVYKHTSAFSFMSFVAWMTFLNVLLDIFLHLFRFWEKLVFFTTYPEILFFLCSLGSFAFLVGSIAELAVAIYAEHPGLAQASAIFGFVCMTVLAIECYFHYQSYLERRDERQERQEKSTNEPAFSDISNVWKKKPTTN